MNINETDISDYVAGRLDALDRFRVEAALASDIVLRSAVERARCVDVAVKTKLGTRRSSICWCGN